jgi:hypothetical protein
MMVVLYHPLRSDMMGRHSLRLQVCWAVLLLQPSFARATSLLSLFNALVNILGCDGGNQTFGSCDGCFCIPESGEACPVDRTPPTEFGSLIPVLRSLTWTNPYQLECDPYRDEGCDTSPPLEVGGACIVHVEGKSNGTCATNSNYTVLTYPGSFEEAKANSSLYVTHAGACGSCSSFEDLSVYMELGAGLSDRAGECGIRGRFNAADGIQCFQEMGFTDACSMMWYYNAKLNSEECLQYCAFYQVLGRPPNGPPPQCKLARCLECDETKAGPVFERFAGRTRRSSGLQSNIARPCSDIVDLLHSNPCE